MKIPAAQVSPYILKLDPSPDRVLRVRKVCERTGLSRPTIWRLVKAGKFPAPFPLSSPAAVGWLASTIDEWIAARAARRPLSAEREHTA
jgi:predicted DNA-binding transcriptional regulator AlpA